MFAKLLDKEAVTERADNSASGRKQVSAQHTRTNTKESVKASPKKRGQESGRNRAPRQSKEDSLIELVNNQ